MSTMWRMSLAISLRWTTRLTAWSALSIVPQPLHLSLAPAQPSWGMRELFPDNVQSNSDAIFHSFSFEQAANFIESGEGASCGKTQSSTNSVPSVIQCRFCSPCQNLFSDPRFGIRWRCRYREVHMGAARPGTSGSAIGCG